MQNRSRRGTGDAKKKDIERWSQKVSADCARKFRGASGSIQIRRDLASKEDDKGKRETRILGLGSPILQQDSEHCPNQTPTLSGTGNFVGQAHRPKDNRPKRKGRKKHRKGGLKGPGETSAKVSDLGCCGDCRERRRLQSISKKREQQRREIRKNEKGGKKRTFAGWGRKKTYRPGSWGQGSQTIIPSATGSNTVEAKPDMFERRGGTG